MYWCACYLYGIERHPPRSPCNAELLSTSAHVLVLDNLPNTFAGLSRSKRLSYLCDFLAVFGFFVAAAFRFASDANAGHGRTVSQMMKYIFDCYYWPSAPVHSPHATLPSPLPALWNQHHRYFLSCFVYDSDTLIMMTSPSIPWRIPLTNPLSPSSPRFSWFLWYRFGSAQLEMRWIACSA